MRRFAPAAGLCALLLAAPPAPAQPERAEIPTVELTVSPAKAPLPALRYRLLPEARELETGNAVFHYYRSFLREWSPEGQREVNKWIEEWSEDRDKMPPDGLRSLVNGYTLQVIDRGARSTYCDWEMIPRIREAGIGTLLPDVQMMRSQANLLAARARFLTADGKVDEAARALQTGLKFGRDVGHGPTLIQSLVGIAVVHIMLEEVEHFIEKDGMPNLYWSLSDLPAPVVDLHFAMQGEKIFLDQLLPGVRRMVYDRDLQPLSPEQLRVKLEELMGNIGLLEGRGGGQPGLQQWGGKVALAALAARAYPEARQFLLDQGHPKEAVDRVPVLQAALIYEVYNYDRLFDDFAKWYSLPPRAAVPGLAREEQAFMKEIADSGSVGIVLAKLLLPAVTKVFDASARTDRKIATLRAVEALRLYAAEHGRWPDKLADVVAAPVPDDPTTGEPFRYEVRDGRAILTAPVPPALGNVQPHIGNSWRYVLTLRK